MLWASFGSLSVIPWILFAQSSWNLDTMAGTLGALRSLEAQSEIRDRADIFDLRAVERSLKASTQAARRSRVPIRVESVKSLDGAWIADVARRKARAARPEQLYVLVAADEREVGLIPARQGRASRLSDQDREQIRLAFLGPVQAGEFDRALEKGIRAIGTALAASKAERQLFDRQDALILTAILAVLAVYPISRLGAWINRGRRLVVAGDSLRAGTDASSSDDSNRETYGLPAIVIYPPALTDRPRLRKRIEAN